MAQFTRPEATITNQGYVNQANSGSFLFQSLDEVTASDVDYISSPVDPSGAIYVTRLSDALDPLSAVNHVVRYRYRKVGPGTTSLDVQLRQGYVSEASQGTLIASWSHSGISTTSVTAGQALSAAEANAITDYIQLYLRFSFTAVSTTFGPVAGAATVRSGVGPRTVVQGTNGVPTGGVSFNTSSNIQTLIDSNAANTVFVTSTAGTYNNFRNIVYSGKHPRFVFVGAAASYNISGGSLDGWGLNGTGSGTSGGLEVYGGTWTAYGTPAGSTVGGVVPINIGGGGGSSIIQDAVFSANNQIGVSIYINAASSGSLTTMLLSHCTFLNNGRYGFSGSSLASADSSAWFYTPIVEYCLIDGNNARHFDTGDDAGGQKFSYTDGMILRNNWYKNTFGHAMWFDGYNRNGSAHDNVMENNTGMGVFFEIGRGGWIFEHNYLVGNGSTTDNNYPFNGTEFVISCSPADASAVGHFPGPNVTGEVRYNDVDASGYQTPIILYTHAYHPTFELTRNWYVHHNRMWMRAASGVTGRVGVCDAVQPDGTNPSKTGDIGLASSNNRFDYNEYHVANTSGAYWEHDTSALMNPGPRTWAQFQASPATAFSSGFRQEAHGTRVVI